MDIDDIDYKLKPMIKDLEWINHFNYYLSSSDFERLCIINSLGEIWDTAKKSVSQQYLMKGKFLGESTIAFKAFLNIVDFTYKTHLDSRKSLNPLILGLKDDVNTCQFNEFLYMTFSGFILSMSQISEKFLKILDDLDYLPFTNDQKKSLQTFYLEKTKRLKEELAEKKKQEERIAIEKEDKRLLKLQQQKASSLKTIKNVSKKKNWLIDISEAKYDKVIKEIRDIAIEQNKDEWIGNILNISSRWFTLNDQIIKGTGNQHDISIELNRINQSLLHFVKNLEDTEGY